MPFSFVIVIVVSFIFCSDSKLPALRQSSGGVHSKSSAAHVPLVANASEAVVDEQMGEQDEDEELEDADE